MDKESRLAINGGARAVPEGEGKMNSRERMVRAIEFKNPDRIPLVPGVRASAGLKHGKDLEKLLNSFPLDIPEYRAPKAEELSRRNKTGRWTDEWGCTWNNQREGEFGFVVGHPLEDWAKFSSHPFPIEPVELGKVSNNGEYYLRSSGATEYGVLWYRMQWLRGCENLLIDIAEDRRSVYQLRDKVMECRIAYLKEVLKLEIDGVHFGDDWGTQKALMINPEKWRAIFKPAYKELFGLAHSAGKRVFMQSDGYTWDIIPDLVEIGVDVLRVSLGLMNLEELSKLLKGKTCVWTDLDRQHIMPNGSVKEVRKHVRAVIAAFKTSLGGMIGGMDIELDVPLENIKAACETFLESE